MNFFAVNTESRYVETVPTPITFEKVVLGENAFKVNKCRDTITAQAEGDAFITTNVVWESGRSSTYMQYYATLETESPFWFRRTNEYQRRRRIFDPFQVVCHSGPQAW